MNRFPILNTKLYKPEVKAHHVFRKEIVENLEQNRYKPLTIVVAATGYGKSVTISEWLDYTKAKYCWISVDEGLNDFHTFLSYLAASVRTAVKDSLAELCEFLGAQELPPDNVIINTLINELDEIRDDLILVLDDYHFVMNQKIHDLIGELLKYPPAKFHLVIISRRDPPLKINTLKSFGKVNEIRISDLRFTLSETLTLANKLIQLELNEKLIENLLEKTEGWIVGLRLALLTITEEKDLEKTVKEIKGEKHFFTRYLLDEVFLRQEKKVQEILLIASLFDRFNKDLLKLVLRDHPLINESTDYSVFDNLFDRFKNSSLFIISLDSNEEWFRFHHFFKDFLLRRLEKEYTKSQMNELRKKASEYLDKNELFEEALDYSLKSGDINFAVNIVEKNKYKILDTDQFDRLNKWLGVLPTGTIEQHLGLLLARAFLYDTLSDYNSMGNDLFLAKKLIAENNADLKSQKQFLGEFHSVYSNWSFHVGNFEDAYDHSKKAMELLTDRSTCLRDYALAHHAFSLNALGKFNDAIFILKDKLRKLSASESNSRLRNLLVQAGLYVLQGNISELMKLSHESHSISIEKKWWVSMAYSTYYLSETNYQWNNLDEAIDYAATLDDHYYSGGPALVLQTLYSKAFAFNVLRKYRELSETITEIKEVTENINNEVFHNLTRAFEVELAIRQNDTARALKLAKITNFESFHKVLFFYFPQMTFVKLLICEDEPNKLAEAEKRVKELIVQSRTTHKYNILMQALLLQSLLFSKKDNVEFAVKTLKEAIKLAEPGGFIRIFVDLGEPMKNLLKEIYRRGIDNSYISKLLQAFEREKAPTGKIQDLQKELSPALILNDFEKLSGWEIKLLKLISEGHSNKEIADQLHLSYHSIKKYLYDIYQKLKVHNRVAAILKANELGLISYSGKI